MFKSIEVGVGRDALYTAWDFERCGACGLFFTWYRRRGNLDFTWWRGGECGSVFWRICGWTLMMMATHYDGYERVLFEVGSGFEGELCCTQFEENLMGHV